jgi:hypothetical protein
MYCGIFCLLAIVLLVMAWFRPELSLKTKLFLTGTYLATWLVALLEPLAMMVLQGVYALGMYFFLFGSQGGRRWRP